MIIDSIVLRKGFMLSSFHFFPKGVVSPVPLSFRSPLVRGKRNAKFQKKRVTREDGQQQGTGAVTKRADFIHLADTFPVLV